MKAKIYVTLKNEVLDPQGDAVRGALTSLGIGGVRSVRVGKMIEVELDREGDGAKRDLEAACKKLLANPVIEDFRIELV